MKLSLSKGKNTIKIILAENKFLMYGKKIGDEVVYGDHKFLITGLSDIRGNAYIKKYSDINSNFKKKVIGERFRKKKKYLRKRFFVLGGVINEFTSIISGKILD